MTNEEILQKAIEKAQENGFSLEGEWRIQPRDEVLYVRVWVEEEQYDKGMCVPEIIFSHDFAKAFWGEVPNALYAISDDPTKEELRKLGWQHHLQQMVLEENPLQYLERFL